MFIIVPLINLWWFNDVSPSLRGYFIKWYFTLIRECYVGISDGSTNDLLSFHEPRESPSIGQWIDAETSMMPWLFYWDRSISLWIFTCFSLSCTILALMQLEEIILLSFSVPFKYIPFATKRYDVVTTIQQKAIIEISTVLNCYI